MYFYHMWSRRETTAVALVTYLLWKTQETMDRQIGAPRGQIGVQNPGYASVWQRGPRYTETAAVRESAACLGL